MRNSRSLNTRKHVSFLVAFFFEPVEDCPRLTVEGEGHVESSFLALVEPLVNREVNEQVQRTTSLPSRALCNFGFPTTPESPRRRRASA
jgi:hypothetical protein